MILKTNFFGLFTKSNFSDPEKLIQQINLDAADLNNKINAAMCANLKAEYYKSGNFKPRTRIQAINAYSYLVDGITEFYGKIYDIHNSGYFVGTKIITSDITAEIAKMLSVAAMIENLSIKFNREIAVDKISSNIAKNIKSIERLTDNTVKCANANYKKLNAEFYEFMTSFWGNMANYAVRTQ